MGTVFASDAGPSHVFCPSCVGRVEAAVSHDHTGLGFSAVVPRDVVTVVRCLGCRLVLRVEVDPRTMVPVPTGVERLPTGEVIHGLASSRETGDVCSHLRAV